MALRVVAGPDLKPVFEHEPAGTERVGEVIGHVVMAQQLDELAVMGRRDDDVGLSGGSSCKDGFGDGDPLDRVGAAKQLVEEKQSAVSAARLASTSAITASTSTR